jgi:hypothetical protein
MPLKNLLLDLRNVCDRIETHWQKYDYDSNEFYKIAYEHTTHLDLSPLGELKNLLLLMEEPNIASLQYTTSFSNLHFLLFDNRRFQIEVLNWWGLDINIHDHDFSGVQFQLRGNSLNTVYKFTEEERCGGLSLGALELTRAEIWQPGDRSLVLPGDSEPHTVFHLNVPTVSLLFRSCPTPRLGPQRNYFPPHLRGTYEVASPLQRKKLGALKLLAIGDPEQFRQSFRQMLPRQSHCEVLFLLLKLGEIVFRQENAVLLAEYARKGAIEEKIVRAVSYRRALEQFSDALRAGEGLSFPNKLASMVVAAAHDQTTFSTIVSSVRNHREYPLLEKALRELPENLSPQGAQALRRYLALFGVEIAL